MSHIASLLDSEVSNVFVFDVPPVNAEILEETFENMKIKSGSRIVHTLYICVCRHAICSCRSVQVFILHVLCLFVWFCFCVL